MACDLSSYKEITFSADPSWRRIVQITRFLMGAGYLLLLLAAGVATSHHQSHHGWKHGVKYQYEMRGRNVAGLHQVANQYVGLLTRGVVNIQPRADGRINVHMEQPEKLDVHTQLPRGWRTFIPDEGSNYTPLSLNTNTFDLKFNGGVVEKMWVQKGTPTHEVNMLKAIASLLQMDTTGVNSKESTDNQQSESNFLNFKTMESSVSGEVETTYNIAPLHGSHLQARPSMAPLVAICPESGALLQVNKALNFSRAHHLPAYHFGLPKDVVPGSNMYDMLSRSANSRSVVCGDLDNFLIQSSVATDKVLVAPHLFNDQKGIVASEFNLTLVNAVDSQQEPPSVSSGSDEYNSLQYQYNPAIFSDNPNEEGRSKRSKRGIQLKRAEASNETEKRPGTSHVSKKTDNSSKEDRNRTNGSEGHKVNAIGGKGIKSHQKNTTRASHTTRHHKSSDSDSSSSFSFSSEETFWLRRPSLQLAPAIPLHAYWIGMKGASIQNSEINTLETVGKFIKSIAQDLSQPNTMSHEQTLSKFSRLVAITQTMNETMMHQALDKFYVNHPHVSQTSKEAALRYKSWSVARDAASQAGTGPALVLMKNWIANGKIKGEEAAKCIATIGKMALYPTQEFVDMFFEIVAWPEVSKQNYLNSSAIIAFSDLIRRVFVANETTVNYYPVHTYGLPHPPKSDMAAQKYLPYLKSKLEEAIKSGDSTVIQQYIWALGQTSHWEVLNIFEPYLCGTNPISNFQRLTMVASLNEMSRIYPKQVRPLMFKIYQSMEETPEIRVAAVMQLMRTNPPAQLLQRMAQFTNYETSKQVNSAVKSAIESASEAIQGHEESQLKQNAKSAKDLLTLYQYGIQYSKVSVSSWEKKNIDLSYLHEMTNIKSEDNVFPSSYFCKITRSLGGFQNPPSKLFASTSSLSNLWTFISSQTTRQSSNGEIRNRAISTKSTMNYEDIARKLNVSVSVEDQIEGYLMTSLLGTNRLFTFDNHTLEQLPRNIKDFVEDVRHPKALNMTKMYDQLSLKIAFPTAIGLPFSFAFNVPTVIALNGQIQGKVHPDPARQEGHKTPMPLTLNVTADVDILYSAMSEGKMGFVAPFSQKEYSSGLRRQVHARLPLSIDLDVDLENVKVSWSSAPLQPKMVHKVLEYTTTPYTSIHDLQDLINPPEMQVINVRRTHNVNAPISILGMAFDIQMHTQQEFLSWSNVYEAVSKHDFMTALLYPTAEEAINYNNFTLTYDGPRSSTQMMKGTVKYNTVEGQNVEDNAATPKPPSSRKSKGQPESKLSSQEENFDTGFDSHEREMQILKRVADGIKDATSTMLDISLDLRGANQSTMWVSTFAHGGSHNSNVSRFIAFSSYGDDSKKSSQYKVFALANITSPPLHIFNFSKALEEDTYMQVNGSMRFGVDHDDARMNFELFSTKTEERRENLAQREMSSECYRQMAQGHLIQPACRNVTGRAGFMDSYSATLNYNERVPATLKRLTYITYTIGRYYMSDYMSEQLAGRGAPQGQATARWNISPDEKLVNVSIASPAVFANFTNVPLNPMVGRPVFVVHPTYNVASRLASKFTRNQYFPICAFEGSLVNTFDNATYSTNLGNCWYSVAHSSPRFGPGTQDQLGYSVLARDMPDKKKEVMMVLGFNAIYLQPGTNGPRVGFNGKNVVLPRDQTIRFWDKDEKHFASAYLTPGKLVVVESVEHKMQVLYDGTRVIVQLINSQRGQVRGLCGNFNGEKNDDLLAPDNNLYKNPILFSSKWALPDGTCSVPKVKDNDVNKVYNGKGATVTRPRWHY